MRYQVAIPESHVTKDVLDAGLESVTRLNEQLISSGEVPSFDRALRYGVRWKPEPPGDEHFDSADQVIKRKWGDCDDLAPYQAATLRVTGEDPGATAIVRRSGPKRWHAVVQRSDGTIDDPSKRAGMGPGIAPGVFGEYYPHDMGVVGAIVPLMMPPDLSSVVGAYIVRPQIALRPHYGQFQARADLPWNWREHMAIDTPNDRAIAMTALHTAPVAQTALTGAIDHVCQLAHAAGVGDSDHLDRLCCISDAVEGADYHELAQIYGQEHAEAATAVVGSFFGKIARGIGKVVKKVGPTALSFVPGVGPIASTALKAGMSFIPTGGGRRPGPAPAAPRPPVARPAPASQPGLAYPRSPIAQPATGVPGTGKIIIHVH
jgi:hypothetical protein